MFNNLRSYAPNGEFRNFSKPDYLKLKEPLLTSSSAAHSTTADKDKKEDLGNRMVLSKHTVWITVEEKSNFSRKNAPEVAKVPQTEA